MGKFDKLVHGERTPDAINIVQIDTREGQAHLRIQSSLCQRGTKRRKVIRARPQVSELLARRRQARGRVHDVPRRLLIVSSWWMLREIEAPNATLQCVLLLCRSASGAAHKQDPFCGPSHNQIPGICLCRCAKELARTNSKSRSRGSLFPTSSANAATKLQVSSTVRQAAGLHRPAARNAHGSLSLLQPHLSGPRERCTSHLVV